MMQPRSLTVYSFEGSPTCPQCGRRVSKVSLVQTMGMMFVACDRCLGNDPEVTSGSYPLLAAGRMPRGAILLDRGTHA